jgi:hypothetical protein
MIWEQTKQREFRVQKGHTARAKEEIPVNTIHILKAVLCADCEVISDGARDTCVVCGSRSLLSLGRVLGGTIGQERAVLVPTNEEELRSTVMGKTENLKPWPKGVSGNPGGRPKTRLQ